MTGSRRVHAVRVWVILALQASFAGIAGTAGSGGFAGLAGISGAAGVAGMAAVAGLATGCAERQPAAGRPAAPESTAAGAVRLEHAYIVNPLEGYAQSVDPARRERLARVFAAFSETGSLVEARQVSGEMLEVAPSFAPAKVLAAQVDFAAGNFRAVVDRLLAVGDAQPNYTASQLLLGRASELLGDLPLAYSAYRAIAARNAKALERTGALHARALEIVSRRLQEALRSPRPDRLEEADRQLTLLKAWAPGEPPALEGARALALARQDRRAELEAIKGLAAGMAKDRALQERRADLEVEIGDPGAGLKIIQELAERYPGDAKLTEKLHNAKFRWRLSLLPPDVRQRADKPELSRADLSVLLYWLVPQVRYAKAAAGRIATDILDTPHRDEIVHVVNLGLMDVEPNLHRFSPAAPVRRGAALRTVARLLAGFGSGVDCAAGPSPGGGAAPGPCELGVACGLVDDQDGCNLQAPLSGPEAVEWIWRTLQLLGDT